MVHDHESWSMINDQLSIINDHDRSSTARCVLAPLRRMVVHHKRCWRYAAHHTRVRSSQMCWQLHAASSSRRRRSHTPQPLPALRLPLPLPPPRHRPVACRPLHLHLHLHQPLPTSPHMQTASHSMLPSGQATLQPIQRTAQLPVRRMSRRRCSCPRRMAPWTWQRTCTRSMPWAQRAAAAAAGQGQGAMHPRRPAERCGAICAAWRPPWPPPQLPLQAQAQSWPAVAAAATAIYSQAQAQAWGSLLALCCRAGCTSKPAYMARARVSSCGK